MFFFLEMSSTSIKNSLQMNINRGLFGVRKWQYEKLDDIDLLGEISILIDCELLGKCRACTKHLKWIIEILKERWDSDNNVDFEEALKIVRKHKKFFQKSIDKDKDRCM